MKVSLIQKSIEWLSRDNNRATAEKMIAEAAGSALVVLPEMFTTGFCTDPKEGAETEGETLEWMQQMAAKYNCALVGSVSVERVGAYFNRLYFVFPDGEYDTYDKHHLFTYSGEHKRYTAGEERVVVEYNGVRFLLLVCYDLRFPVWSRNRGDYDAIICVAAWPKQRRYAWDTLLRARAIENLSYVLGVNIVGEDPQCSYSGGTVALDFLGAEVAKVEDDTQGIARFELDMEALQSFRSTFPALNDADDFDIK